MAGLLRSPAEPRSIEACGSGRSGRRGGGEALSGRSATPAALSLLFSLSLVLGIHTATTAAAQPGGRLSVAAEEVRALRLAARPELALCRAELALSEPLEAAADSLAEDLVREVAALPNPAADLQWMHTSQVLLPVGISGVLGIGAGWLYSDLFERSQSTEIGLLAGLTVSAVVATVGLVLLFVHHGENTFNGDHRAFERRRHDVLRRARRAAR